MKPLLLVDVDGVLNPFSRASPDFRRYECTIGPDSYTVHLNLRHGARLMELALKTGSELVWATTWEHNANEWIAPRLGLPELPVVPMTPEDRASGASRSRRPASPTTWTAGRSSGSTTTCGWPTRSTSGDIRVSTSSC
ncbi:HAD domain-containing protein [Nonomuraea recticatena]|uniref:HAD domain-containing protein n=1 Tax=Nonomuraea recticatena TaxID=46178 RepID=UPI003622E33F